eukprot:gb/GFBE01010845.1/.p1 GENE.gb/GFBE01010845.1/~~gb/GFBE01010845.1/.p1  ORF type:complete len:610 (+),score=124.05 gb/GFBE01010845.1/:1-1830(+)
MANFAFILLALVSSSAASDVACVTGEDDGQGVYLVQTDRRAVKTAAKQASASSANPSPLTDAGPSKEQLERQLVENATQHFVANLTQAQHFADIPFSDPDVLIVETKLRKLVPWLFDHPTRVQFTSSIDVQDLQALPLETLPSELGHAKYTLARGGQSAATNIKICVSTPFILWFCYWITMRLKANRLARRTGAAKFDAAPIYMMCLIATIGGTMIVTLKPYIALDFGASAGMVGLLQSAFSFTQFFGTLIMGWLSDKVGRKKLLLVLPIGHIVAHLGCAASSSYWPFFCSRLLLGCFGGLVSISEALIAENTPKEECAGALGKLMAFLGLGVVLGPAMASLLAPLGTANIFYVTAFLALLIWVWLLWAFDDSWKGALPAAERTLTENSAPEETTETPQVAPNWGMLLFWYAFVILGNAGGGSSMSMLPLFYLDVYSIQERTMGLMFMLSGIVLMVAQGALSGVVSKKFGETGAVILGVGGGCFWMVLLIFVRNPAMPWILVVGSTAMGAFTDPTSCSAVAGLANHKNRGMLLGIYQALRALGQGIGPILGGFLYEIAMLLPFYVSLLNGLGLLAACVVVLCISKRQVPSMEQAFEEKVQHEADAKQAA